MTRTYPPLILGFWVLLAAALAFAILPRLMRRPPQPVVAPPVEGSRPVQPVPEAQTPSAGQIAVPRSSLFSDGTAPRPTSLTSPGAPLAAPVPLVGVRPPAAFADRPGGIFSAPPEGR